MRGTCSDGSAQHSLFSPSFFTGRADLYPIFSCFLRKVLIAAYFHALAAASMWAAQHSNGPLDSSVFSPALGSLATDDPHHTIFCGGFAASVTERDLVLLFSQFGPVSRARVITDSRTNQSKGYAGSIAFLFLLVNCAALIMLVVPSMQVWLHHFCVCRGLPQSLGTTQS